jgi:2-polyprenyl-3-methyl-5-hydroxy-6-metoxy-1,4-benzoquinol methylase
MKKPDPLKLLLPYHRLLYEKDQRELYDKDPNDYYAVQYRQRISRIMETILHHQCKRILEVGCAQATMAISLAEKGCQSAAIDLKMDSLTFSKLKHEKGDLLLSRASADRLPFDENAFDAVILAEILEHCAWPEQILTQAHQALRQNGLVIITTPNQESTKSTLHSFSGVKNDRSQIERHQFGPDGDDHLFAFTLDELTAMVRGAGFSINHAQTIGNHFLQWKQLYHLRHAVPFFWNTVLEAIVPFVPAVGKKYAHGLFVVAKKR